MNIIGEYSIEFNIYTMFDVYPVMIENHNLITTKGYEFFMKKWYRDGMHQDIIYPVQMGYYHNNKFYERKNIDDTYSYELKNPTTGKYSSSVNYIDKDTYKQYWFDGTNFVDFNEKLSKICIGDIQYINDEKSKPLSTDTELYNSIAEYTIDNDGFKLNPKSLVMKCTLRKEDLDNTTEIGVKTNHGRLVSHDIHAPYHLPFGTDLTLEYVFKLDYEE